MRVSINLPHNCSSAGAPIITTYAPLLWRRERLVPVRVAIFALLVARPICQPDIAPIQQGRERGCRTQADGDRQKRQTDLAWECVVKNQALESATQRHVLTVLSAAVSTSKLTDIEAKRLKDERERFKVAKEQNVAHAHVQ